VSDRRPPVEDRRLLGDLLIEAGIATRRAITSGLEEQRVRGGRLGFNLLKMGLATPASLHLFLEDHFEVLQPGLAGEVLTRPPVDRIPGRLAHYYGMVPVAVEDGVLALGLSSADVPALIPAVEELTGLRVDPLICPPSLITEVLRRFYPAEVEPGVLYFPGAENHLVLADRGRGIVPVLPEVLRADAPPSDRLRALAAEAVRRGARSIRVEPQAKTVRVVFSGRRVDDEEVAQDRGSYPGLARLIEGLAGMASRGRTIPKTGRFTLLIEGRRVAVSVSALPGLEGDTYTLDLRDERIATPKVEEIRSDLPGLAPLLDRLAEDGRGLLVVAAADSQGAATAIRSALDLLGGRRPGRVGLGEIGALAGLEAFPLARDGEAIDFTAVLDRAVQSEPDIVLIPDLLESGRAAAAAEQAGRRITLATLTRPGDAADAVETIGRAGLGRLLRPVLSGILAVRLMEELCAACRRPVDLIDLLAPSPAHRRPPPGTYAAAQGCAACRGSGVLRLQPVFDLLTPTRENALFASQGSAAVLRRDRVRRGEETLCLAGLRKAATGLVDVREPLRLLLHER
jgi:type II secretory ATPase GspE/PulE/Tfp pilus assembly ATPase PilB-like protein